VLVLTSLPHDPLTHEVVATLETVSRTRQLATDLTRQGRPSMQTKRLSALLAVTVATMPSVVRAQQFEGVARQRTISIQKYALEDKGFEMSKAIFDVPLERILALRDDLEADGSMTVEETSVYVKGSLIRSDMETEEGPAYVTMDLGNGVIRMFQPSEKMYIEWTKEDMERMKSMMPNMGGASERPEPRATGLSKKINGMNCVAYDIDTEDGATRVWVSKDDAQLVAAFAALMESISSMAMAEGETDASTQVAKYGFPVLTLQLGPDSYEIEETLSVDRQSVSDDLFTPPAGYKKMTLADMMRGGN